jgi:hypothetical protein
LFLGLESLRGTAFRAVIAVMLEYFGHQIINGPAAFDLVRAKDGQKFITDCATATHLARSRKPCQPL